MLWMLNARKGKPEKRKIITRINGYHGVTIGAASMTGKPYNGEFQLPLDGFIHADCPHYWKFGKQNETEDEEGNIVKELEYFSDMTDTDIDEHCQTNDYLFTKHGKPIHHLEEGGMWNNEN